MDVGAKLTDKELEELEAKIHTVYDEAAKDLQKTASSYFSDFYDRDASMRSRVDAGEITNKAYKDWQTAQIGRGMRFEQMSTKMAERATAANIVANDYVNNTMANIYALNYNYGTYMIRDYSEGINFALLDESTVKRLLTDNPQLMPNYPEQRAINRGIDLAYGQKQISNAVTSGILRGTSVQDMARDLVSRVDSMDRTSALRAARTAVTSAQNGGRQDMLNNAIEMGIKAEKMWISTEDDRVRESHFELNGVQVAADDEFPNGLMFPGDPAGDPSEVYNCRCTLGYVMPETKQDFTDGGIYDTGNTVESYNEWMEERLAAQSAGGWGGFGSVVTNAESDSGTTTASSYNRLVGTKPDNPDGWSMPFDCYKEGTLPMAQTMADASKQLQGNYFLGSPMFGIQEYTPSSADKTAASLYSQSTYSVLNNALRTGQSIAGLEDVVAGLDNITSNGCLREGITVMRGLRNSTDSLFGAARTAEEINASLVGTVVTDAGYMSCTLSEQAVADHFGSMPMLLDIKVPAGVGYGADITSFSAHPGEQEFLLARNTSMLITGAETNAAGQTIVHMEIVEVV